MYQGNYSLKIIAILILFLGFFNAVYPDDVVLCAPEFITAQEVEKLPRNWGATFSREAQEICFHYEHDTATVTLTSPNTLLSFMKKITNFFMGLKDGGYDEYLVFAPRDFLGQSKNPLIITKEDFVEFLKTKHVLFYTGAGISMAAGVYGMDQLLDALFLKDVEVFKAVFSENPGRIVNVFKAFCKKAFEAPPTPAHHALASLAQRFSAQIFTENFDFLQERSGVKPINIDASFLRKYVDPESLKKIDMVVCIGMSADDRGFLGWYKHHNPVGKLVALNINQPVYLGDEDYLLLDDIQEVLPEIARNFDAHKI